MKTRKITNLVVVMVIVLMGAVSVFAGSIGQGFVKNDNGNLKRLLLTVETPADFNLLEEVSELLRFEDWDSYWLSEPSAWVSRVPREYFATIHISNSYVTVMREGKNFKGVIKKPSDVIALLKFGIIRPDSYDWRNKGGYDEVLVEYFLKGGREFTPSELRRLSKVAFKSPTPKVRMVGLEMLLQIYRR